MPWPTIPADRPLVLPVARLSLPQCNKRPLALLRPRLTRLRLQPRYRQQSALPLLRCLRLRPLRPCLRG